MLGVCCLVHYDSFARLMVGCQTIEPGAIRLR